MKKHIVTEKEKLAVRKLTGMPPEKVTAALESRMCSFDRFRHFCLNQGVMPSPDQQLALKYQDDNGLPYEFPSPSFIHRVRRACDTVDAFAYSLTALNHAK